MIGIEGIFSYVTKFFKLLPSSVQKILRDLSLKIIFNDQLMFQLGPPSVFLRRKLETITVAEAISDIHSLCLWRPLSILRQCNPGWGQACLSGEVGEGGL